MNLASNTAPVASTMPSRVAAIQRTTGCCTRRWTAVRTWPVLRSIPLPVERLGHDAELDDKVAGEILRLDLAAFLAPQPKQGGSSSPMMIRASEPPMKRRRSAEKAAAALSNIASSGPWRNLPVEF